MNTKDYVDIIGKTKKYPQNVADFGICYTYLGLSGESRELYEAVHDTMLDPKSFDKKRVMKEAGDKLWYITAMALEAGLDPISILEEDMEDTDIKARNYDADLGIIAEHLKKFYRDGKPIDPSLIENVLRSHVALMKRLLSIELPRVLGVELIKFEDVLALNYEKLTKRKETGTLQGDGDDREDKVSPNKFEVVENDK